MKAAKEGGGSGDGTSSDKAPQKSGAAWAIATMAVPIQAVVLLRLPAPRSGQHAAIAAAVRVLLHLRPSCPLHRRSQHRLPLRGPAVADTCPLEDAYRGAFIRRYHSLFVGMPNARGKT